MNFPVAVPAFLRRLLQEFRRDLSKLDHQAVTALLYAAIGLAGIYYLKQADAVNAIFGFAARPDIAASIINSANSNLPMLAWWVSVAMVFYFLIPALIIRFVWKRKLADFGLRMRAERDALPILSTCFAIMAPLVFLFSGTQSFAAKYPFVQISSGEPYFGPLLLYWELLYFLQFFGLEFFFRGFLVHSLKNTLGFYSVFVMTVPYCMIHFGKPAAETISAVIAGIFLGWLSLRNGGIWIGLALHCGVAFLMDLLALYNKGLLAG
ncbi:MAG: CPBP family intramembrane metalloprotease [Blastocatellia bacterium]